jgi:hypothetical protein
MGADAWVMMLEDRKHRKTRILKQIIPWLAWLW